jgi:hypothetical protein
MAQHPLEPLSADEFRRTTEILHREGHVTETFRFASIELMEPAKQEVLAWRAGDALPRHSFAVVWNRADNKTYEATVDLTGDAVLSFKLTGRPSGWRRIESPPPTPDVDLAFRTATQSRCFVLTSVKQILCASRQSVTVTLLPYCSASDPWPSALRAPSLR